MQPIVIAVAITGSVPRKKDNPALPTTPSEQIESTHEAFEAGASEEQALNAVLPWLSEARTIELAAEAVELYCWDRLGSDN